MIMFNKNYCSDVNIKPKTNYISRDIKLFQPKNGIYLTTSPSSLLPFQTTWILFTLIFLQVICRDLFKSKWYEGGLLASIPSASKKKLNRILDECAAETTIPWTKHKFNRIFNTLKRYLLDEQSRL